MQLSIDLTGRDILVTGTDTAARQAVRRYRAAGAVVHRRTSPHAGGLRHGSEGARVPEQPFLVAAVDDGQPGCPSSTAATRNGRSGRGPSWRAPWGVLSLEITAPAAS